MEFPDDVLELIAKQLGGRARRVCRAFNAPLERNFDTLKEIREHEDLEITFGQMWTCLLSWQEEDDTFMDLTDVPYGQLLRSNMRCLPEDCVVFDRENPTDNLKLRDWKEPAPSQPKPKIILEGVPLRRAVLMLTNMGPLHSVRSSKRLSYEQGWPITAPEGCTHYVTALVYARKGRVNSGRGMYQDAPPYLARTPAGTWFLCGQGAIEQLPERPEDIQAVVDGAWVEKSKRPEFACNFVYKTTTLLSDRTTLAQACRDALDKAGPPGGGLDCQGRCIEEGVHI